MMERTNAWAQAWAAGALVEYKMRVAGVEYPVAVSNSDTPCPTSACRVSHKLLTANALIGNTCSAMLAVTYLPAQDPPKQAEIELFARLVVPGGSVTDWLPQRVFYVDERSKDYHGHLQLIAYDRLLFAEEEWFADGLISGEWPKTAPEVAALAAEKLGVELDSRSPLMELVEVSCPIGQTIRDVLANIAAAHGGNWIMSNEGKLLLVLLPAADAAGHELGYSVKKYLRTAERVNVSSVELLLDEETSCKAGTDTGYHVEANCTIADSAAAELAHYNLADKPFVPYNAQNARLDPAAEMGDRIFVAGDSTILGEMVLECSAANLAEIGAMVSGEVQHEIPYKSRVTKLIDRSEAKMRSEIQIGLDYITSVVEDVEAGVGSQIDQRLDQITLTVTEHAGADGEVYSQITLKVGENSYSGLIAMVGNVQITGQMVADAIYSVMGEFANLKVDQLSTSRRIVRYLAGDKSDDNFVRIEEERMEFVTGTTAGSSEQAKSPNGDLLYWEANPSACTLGADGYPYLESGERVFMTVTETNWPVKVYVYEEQVKRCIAFVEINETRIPVDVIGAGDQTGYNRGMIYKDDDEFTVAYVPSDGQTIGVKMGNDGYVDIVGLRKPLRLDFSGWDNGSFIENLDGIIDDIVYNVSFDEQGRPVTITDEVGHETQIVW